ncbi:MAG: hypothetical protein MRZ83_02325, partial [Prevotella sp.]|nr:hypothetical protein [Prevotella sp.]
VISISVHHTTKVVQVVDIHDGIDNYFARVPHFAALFILSPFYSFLFRRGDRPLGRKVTE